MNTVFRRGNKRPRFSVGGHVILEHDDSSNHSGLGVTDYEDESLSQPQATIITSSSSDSSLFLNQATADRPRRIQKSLTKTHYEDSANLNACLNHLLRTLSRKDKQGFFQYPVTDQFAPGYSQIITRPMDFSTMKKKISQERYSNIIEFRSDFELMCDNAMKYNRPDTIYWQAAKKLLAVGTKLMNKDKLLSYRRNLECFSHLTERELGFRIDSSNNTTDEATSTFNETFDSSMNDSENMSTTNLNQSSQPFKPKLILKLPKFYEKPPVTLIPDDDDDIEASPEEILSQARQASQCARDKIRLHRSLSSYTVAYQRISNLTSLRFINQDDFSQQTVTVSESNSSSTTNDKSLNSTSSSLPVIIRNNDKETNSSSREFLENGPFSTNASQTDSYFTNLSKEELDLLIHTYGSEFSAQYAVSLMDYVKNAGDLALAYVDRFLSVLTNGEHDNLMMKRKEKQMKTDEHHNKIDDTIANDNVSSRNEMSPLDHIKVEPMISTHSTLSHPQSDSTLNENSKAFMHLAHESFSHLSQSSNQLHDSMNDYDAAEKDVLFNFTDMASLSNESDRLISSDSIHHNLSLINDNEPSLPTFDAF